MANAEFSQNKCQAIRKLPAHANIDYVTLASEGAQLLTRILFLCCIILQTGMIAKMFQASPLSYNPEYLIRTRYPLETLRPNACPRFSLQVSSSGKTSSDTSKYSHQRAVKNPLLQRNPDDEQGRRRQVFLDKVRQVSADKKWESRSEQVCDHHK